MSLPICLCLAEQPRADRGRLPPSSSEHKTSHIAVSEVLASSFPEGSDSECDGHWIHAQMSKLSWKLF